MSNKIYVNIIDSNIQEFSPKKIFKLKLLKCVGTGAYGFIFLTNINRYAVKILSGKPKDINNEISDGLTDYTEVDVISRIIERKEEFEINCANYAYGFLLNNEKTTDNKQIKLIVNKDMCVEEVMSEIVRKDKIKKVNANVSSRKETTPTASALIGCKEKRMDAKNAIFSSFVNAITNIYRSMALRRCKSRLLR